MRMTKTEKILALACAVLMALALFGPPLAQPANYHAFADQRVLWGVPFAMDVLSNLPFAIAGFAGGWMLWRAPRHAVADMERAMSALFFAGLVVTSCASTWYHLNPNDAGLMIDRLGMCFAFAGLLGLATTTKISPRAGAALGLAVLVAASASVLAWSVTGNLMPWATVQASGMVFIAAMVFLATRPGSLEIAWHWVIAAYVVAKLLEINDHFMFIFTSEWFSGHTLKHVLAALAAYPVIACMSRVTLCKQNAGDAGTERRTGTRRN
ncbi:MAG: hypothetical protein H7255_18345 [Ramlibacter sp.]|nr:hypothetical protein [Ramlibacter sp.]